MAEPLSHRHDLDFKGASDEPEALDEIAHARAVAEYLGDMISQLESMARLAGLDLLVYLLSMARVEAETNARLAGEGRRLAGR